MKKTTVLMAALALVFPASVMKMGSRHVGKLRDLDFESEALETTDEIAGDLVLVRRCPGAC